eukprot:CAMPEP_0176437154 /NCGR_PEP_ID=MMETSP0127-20121128/18436_1 /TAXON_ID=938130 /ORGANISM="Platyophrya macrostoma, Strain WH" /LENGTH=269 /DNA_ID=CAMNT_0017820693 /DNA_START=24 /DNA_END=833 /DNA_ORIENTATION=+
MDVDAIFEWILSHPKNYPGKQEYIREKLTNGKSVSLRGFGAFTIEIESDKVKPAIFTSVDFKKDLSAQRAERKHIHKIRPCFLVDSKLRYILSRFPGKQEIDFAKSQHSVFQQGFGMIFCNPVPIANATYLAKEVVASILDAFVQAVNDLTQLGYDLRLNFDFCKVHINDRNLSYKYDQSFVEALNRNDYEQKLRRSDTRTPDHWKTTYMNKWMNSTLSTMLKKPEKEEVRTLSEKALALKIMSLDMNTAEKTFHSKSKTVALPTITKK